MRLLRVNLVTPRDTNLPSLGSQDVRRVSWPSLLSQTALFSSHNSVPPLDDPGTGLLFVLFASLKAWTISPGAHPALATQMPCAGLLAWRTAPAPLPYGDPGESFVTVMGKQEDPHMDNTHETD